MIVPTPSVAMNESILAYSTSTPLMSPMPSPSARTITTTAGHGTPDFCKPIASTAQMSMTYPIDRSNWPLAITIVSPSARSATVDVSCRMAAAVNWVGNVRGSRAEKIATSSRVRISRPWTSKIRTRLSSTDGRGLAGGSAQLRTTRAGFGLLLDVHAVALPDA